MLWDETGIQPFYEHLAAGWVHFQNNSVVRSLLESSLQESAVVGCEEAKKIAMHFGNIEFIIRFIFVLRNECDKVFRRSNDSASSDQ